MGDLVNCSLKQDYSRQIALFTQNLPPRPMAPSSPPKLVQGEYESSVSFRSRVTKTKEKYARAVAQYNRSVSSYNRRINEAREKARNAIEGDLYMIRENAFLLLFGPPRVVSTTYNPDTQLFSVTVKGEGQRDSDPTSFTLTLKDPVPNDQAPAFDQKLKTAAPSLTLKMTSDKIVVLSGSVDVAGTPHFSVQAPASGSGCRGSPLS